MGAGSRFQRLFEPGRIGTMQVKNRIAMAPMGTQMYDEGFVTDRLKDYYEARAKGGVGLITIDHLKISYPIGAGKKNTARIDHDKFIPGLAELLAVVHRHGAKMVAQLGHMGPADIAHGSFQPLAASALTRQADYTHPTSSVVDYSQPRAMTLAEIAATTRQFVEAAVRAKRAGFDAVQVHAANRYLLASFVSPYWNRRTDHYGGPIENRARFALEVVRAVREAVGPDYPIVCRVNGEERDVRGGVTIELAARFARLLEQAGVDAIDVSSMHPHSPEYAPGFNVDAAATIKQAVGIPVIVAGRLGPALGAKILEQGKTDFVCIGRPLIADPELPRKTAEDRMEDIVPCVYCVNCLAVDRECTVNPAWGKEREFAITPAPKPRKVMVVGGGPGGMEAARVAAARGHRVTLYERQQSLGGQLRLASVLREEYDALIRYQATQLEKLGVEVRLGRKVDALLVEAQKPEVVVVATGARAELPNIPGIDAGHVFSAADILDLMHGRLRGAEGKKSVGARRLATYAGLSLLKAPGGASLARRLLKLWTPFGKRIVVVGNGLPGIELAYFLTELGKKVSIVDTREALPFGAPPMPVLREFMTATLKAHGTAMITAASYVRVTDQGLSILDQEGKLQTIEGDSVVFATGYRSNVELDDALAGRGCEVQHAGDCAKPCGILDAIRDGARIGRSI